MNTGIALRRTAAAAVLGGIALMAAGTSLRQDGCWVLCNNEEVYLGACDSPSYCCFYWDCVAGVGNVTCCSQSEDCDIVYVYDPPRARCVAHP